MAQMRILKDYMKLAKLNTYSRVITLANGVVITCQKSFNREDIFITMPPSEYVEYTETIESISGIILHPRSGAITDISYIEYVSGLYGSSPVTRNAKGVAGGWGKGGTVLDSHYIYPLDDSDNASFYKGSLTTDTISNGVVVSTNIDDESYGFTSSGVYGNLYWDNGAVYNISDKSWDKPYVILSWRGTPTRHFRLPSNIDIPGFSLFETASPGMFEDTPQYTSFGTKLYQGGDVISEAPSYSWPYNNSGVQGRCLILGAMQDADGVKYIVTQSDHYYTPKVVWQNTDDSIHTGDSATGSEVQVEHALTKPGFWLTLWRSKRSEDKSKLYIDGWELVSEVNYGRNGLPWFGNLSGTLFTCGNGDTLTSSGVLSIKSPTYGHWSESAVLTSVATVGNPPYWSVGTKFYDSSNMTFESLYSGKVYHEFNGDADEYAPTSFSFHAESSVQATDSLYKVFDGVKRVRANLALNPLRNYMPDSWDIGRQFIGGGGDTYTWSDGVDANGYITKAGLCSVTVTDCFNRTATQANPLLSLTPYVYGLPYAHVNNTFSMVNGIAPMSYSFSHGTIDSSGKITSLSGCGIATITITDACGRTATKAVTLPTGTWVLVSGPVYANGGGGTTYNYVGTRNVYGVPASNWYLYGTYFVSETVWCGTNPDMSLGATQLPFQMFSCTSPQVYVVNFRQVYEYRCA